MAHDIGETVFATRGGSYVPKVIVVDDDIDPSDINQVVWAMATRHHPDKRNAMIDQNVLPLVAYLDEKEKRGGITTKIVYNCLLPLNKWSEDKKPIEASFRSYPEELRNHIIKNWKEYGF